MAQIDRLTWRDREVHCTQYDRYSPFYLSFEFRSRLIADSCSTLDVLVPALDRLHNRDHHKRKHYELIAFFTSCDFILESDWCAVFSARATRALCVKTFCVYSHLYSTSADIGIPSDICSEYMRAVVSMTSSLECFVEDLLTESFNLVVQLDVPDSSSSTELRKLRKS